MFYIFHDFMNGEYALFTSKEKLDQFIKDYQQHWMDRIEYEVSENDDYEIMPIYKTDPFAWEVFPDD